MSLDHTPDAGALHAHGRALFDAGDLENAERFIRAAISQRTRFPEALQDLAQLVWLRTGDVDRAAAVFDIESDLRYQKAIVYAAAGLHEQALTAVEESMFANVAFAGLAPLAAQLAMAAQAYDRAEAHAVNLLNRTPEDSRGAEIWIAAQLAQGRNTDAYEAAKRMVEIGPDNQAALALLATAARMVGAPEYAQLCDFEAFVRPAMIERPEGWPSLEAFLVELAASLRPLHTVRRHPFGQSVRLGTQTMADFSGSPDPVIRAFFAAVAPLVGDYLGALGVGADPLRSRNTGEGHVANAWSVDLKAGGSHIDHIHPQGWISSTFYVETPNDALDRDWREGWLKFGEPAYPTVPPVAPEHFVRPAPGMLVLYPSYLWHGTVPFMTDERRLTISFDVLPGQG